MMAAPSKAIDTSYWPLEKIVTLEAAGKQASELKAAGKRIVTVNGSFDILHAGHLNFLGEAKAQGEVLFAGVNSDASIREKKGAERPFVSEQERAGLLAALTVVDFVVVIDAPYDEVQNVLLRRLKADVHVNGSEYGPPEQWIEWPVMQEVGAVGYTVARRPGLATTDLITKIRQDV